MFLPSPAFASFRRAGHWLLGPARQRWLVLTLAVGSLLPFAVLAWYAHPSLDDFSDAVSRRRLGFWASQVELYQHWTGRFSTSPLLSDGNPLRWPSFEALYPAVGLVALSSLGIGMYAWLTTVVGRQWPVRWRWLATGALLALWLARAASVAEVIYWYNGVAVYTLPSAALLLWGTALVRYALSTDGPANKQRRWWSILAVLTILVVGANELLAMPVLSLLTAAAAWAIYAKARQRAGWLGLACLALVVALFSFLAPGNTQRLAAVSTLVEVTPWRTAIILIGGTSYLLLNWLSSLLLWVSTALTLPALARLVAGHSPVVRQLARVPWVVAALGLVMLMMTAMLPSAWATGGLTPLRGRAVLYLFFLVGWLVLALLGLARLGRRRPQWLALLAAGWPTPVAVGAWLLLLAAFFTDHNVRVKRERIGLGSNNIVLAYRDWLGGAARRYDTAQRARYQLLRTTSTSRIQLAPLAVEPPTLLYIDITTDSTYWGNQAYTRYFGKKAVWVGPGGHTPNP